MSLWIFKIIIFSIIFIFLIHNIINFLLESLTIHKKKDILQITNDSYKNIYEALLNNNENENEKEKEKEKEKEIITPINSLPNKINSNNSNKLNNLDNMKNELSNYLRYQMNN
jgi:hypothetical protein